MRQDERLAAAGRPDDELFPGAHAACQIFLVAVQSSDGLVLGRGMRPAAYGQFQPHHGEDPGPQPVDLGTRELEGEQGREMLREPARETASRGIPAQRGLLVQFIPEDDPALLHDLAQTGRPEFLTADVRQHRPAGDGTGQQRFAVRHAGRVLVQQGEQAAHIFPRLGQRLLAPFLPAVDRQEHAFAVHFQQLVDEPVLDLQHHQAAIGRQQDEVRLALFDIRRVPAQEFAVRPGRALQKTVRCFFAGRQERRHISRKHGRHGRGPPPT